MNEESAVVVLTAVSLIVAAFLAVGAVLLIKIMRRRQAAKGLVDARLDTGVRTDPMSATHAERLMRRYRNAALIAGVLAVFAVVAVGVSQ
ncbi:MAG: hypothetical protein ACPHN2_00330 [Sinimarinibacterium flocculans]|uniref:hypothetical protein n=1 Tax=Sinimarinibacterium flocculans TaxID=985250 RepID=UPI002EB91080|nr:hypothetical protein [Pseudomonadota bacterium]